MSRPKLSALRNMLRQRFPYGHRGFIGAKLNQVKLHSDKNHDYAAGGPVFGNFKRVAQILALYPNLDLADPKVVAMIYSLKQLDAVLWGLNTGIEKKVEGLAGRLDDLSIYSTIVQCMVEDDERAG